MTEPRAQDATEFADRMLRTMNEAALALMVSVGHRTGLFDVMAAMPPATSAEIAARADRATGSYWLPADRAPWLTRAAEAGFTAVEVAHLDGDFVNAYIIARKE